MTVDTTEIHETVPSSEVVDDIEVQYVQDSESVTSEVEKDDTEVVSTGNTTPAVGSTVQAVESPSTLDSIYNDVHIIMFLVLFGFCWSCMKSWRMHSLKGVRK